LRGLRVLCIYGSEDKTTGCKAGAASLMERAAIPGGHRIRGGVDAMIELLASGLTPAA
jgi:type IV secretory pathway VirJ component